MRQKGKEKNPPKTLGELLLLQNKCPFPYKWQLGKGKRDLWKGFLACSINGYRTVVGGKEGAVVCSKVNLKKNSLQNFYPTRPTVN
jgi:hypothetical protein